MLPGDAKPGDAGGDAFQNEGEFQLLLDPTRVNIGARGDNAAAAQSLPISVQVRKDTVGRFGWPRGIPGGIVIACHLLTSRSGRAERPKSSMDFCRLGLTVDRRSEMLTELLIPRLGALWENKYPNG